MIVRYATHQVMQDMGLDEVVEEMATDEAEVAVDGSGRTKSKSPNSIIVMRERGISVLKEGN